MVQRKQPRKKQASLTEIEERALEKFSGRLHEILGRLPPLAERVQELLARWEQVSEEASPGLLGGNLLALVNEEVLDEQREHLSENASGRKRPPIDVAEHADFFASLLGEYAALLKVLANIELEPRDALARDWEKAADDLLEAGADIQSLTEELEAELDEAEEGAGEREATGEFQAASPALLAAIWKKSQAGEPLPQEQARLAEIMRLHPEYRAAWESGGKGRETTIGGVNPYMHATMHVAVERQLADGDPPEAAAAAERLVAAGMPRHDAVHRVGNVLMEYIFKMQRHGDFDRPAYVRALNALK